MNLRASAPFTTLYGRFLTRMAVAITALAIIVFSVPSSFDYYGNVCTAATEVCSERLWIRLPQKVCERYRASVCRCTPMRF
jgi:hypothetical protein